MQVVTPQLTADTQSAVIESVSSLVNTANAHFNRNVPLPQITFRASGTRAGSAFLNQNRINFHRTLIAHYPDEYFDNVIPHEVAHIMVYQLNGRVRPHGQEWRFMMETVFKTPARVTHSMDISVLNRKLWTYYCACSSYQLTNRRHLSVSRGKSYICRNCNQVLSIKESAF